uniref:LOW QUALITY PROTEIN: purine nucleoside phosphorylase LACC1 n=1 Tax=Gasterosteus aculeatus aculeatus TaxID=481459 RepID=UPI001A9811DA|nr:LOW QUALITY PROTEIN: purine nucleoside phosphorylase LACC1 [Gasterosteus aculeatus aculeatus]
MSDAVPVVLMDLVHGCGPGCTGAPPPGDPARVFLLCGDCSRDDLRGGSVHVLDSVSTAHCLLWFTRTLDRIDVSSVCVFTTPRGRERLSLYVRRLFTAVYTFDYRVRALICASCARPAHSHPPGEAVSVEEEVTALAQALPALGGGVRVLTSSLIPQCFGHGFSTRTGGVSLIPTLSSLNLFSSSRRRDAEAVVQENRRRLAVHAGFHPLSLRLVKVEHGSRVWVVGRAEPGSYDAMVTDRAGVVLAAPGADCMPILFADPRSKVIGAAHAGWKGTLMGVAMATVEAMVTEFGCRVSDIMVAMGPSVGACCFTLDRQQAQDFLRIDRGCVPDPESARPHVDLRLANRVLLQRGGVLSGHIHDHKEMQRCTSCHPEDFFSHVRDGLNFGTQVGFLWIRGTD